MAPLHRLTSTLFVASALAVPAIGQTPPATTQPAAGAQANSPRPAAAPTQAQTLRRRSIVHHYPYPYPSYYYNDETAGFRNPGGLGRYREYYPPRDRFQNQGAAVDPVRVATFDQGGGPTLADQRAAQQIGIQRENAIQQHIDSYARPYFGYGYGVGYFGGFY